MRILNCRTCDLKCAKAIRVLRFQGTINFCVKNRMGYRASPRGSLPAEDGAAQRGLRPECLRPQVSHPSGGLRDRRLDEPQEAGRGLLRLHPQGGPGVGGGEVYQVFTMQDLPLHTHLQAEAPEADGAPSTFAKIELDVQ